MGVSAILGIVLAIGSIIGGQALEGKLKDIKDPLFKKSAQLIVDGADPKAVSEILEAEVEHHEETGLHRATAPCNAKDTSGRGIFPALSFFPNLRYNDHEYEVPVSLV